MTAQTLPDDRGTRGAPGRAPVAQVESDDPHELLRRLAATPSGDPARVARRTAVIEAWLPLAEQLARRYAGRGEPLDDIIQTASVGLIKAVDRFEPARGCEFVAFAVPTIQGEIRRHFRDRTWDLRVPRRLQELRLAIRASADNLTQQLGHLPTTGELAADLQVSPQEVVEGMGAGRAYSTLSLDASVQTAGGADTELVELLGEEDSDLAFVELRMTLAPALARLPDREQQILRLRFYGNLTQTEIAQRIGVSQMHVSRLLARSLAMLREALTADDPQPARG
jgi:RNA polymerase sigma-B factor